jgi:hypothetical protein
MTLVLKAYKASVRHLVIPGQRSDSLIRRIVMELDKALRFAAILAWDDLMKASEPGSIRVEYQGKSGISLTA